MTSPRQWRVPFSDVRLDEDDRAAVMAVLESNWLTMGPRIQEFEQAFATALSGGVSAVAVSNATAALHLSLAALGVGPGDEVICPALTFVATANAVRYVGATPVLADICSEDEWNIDPVDVERRITPRTKAIVVVHYGGYPVRMDEILDIARRHGLLVVEDASHGPLSEWRGRKLGTIGDAGCFSFFGNKNMTTGEGGMVVTARADVAERLRLMRSHGMTSNSYARFRGHAFGYDVVATGYNFRMDEMRAALGISQLRKLASGNAYRGGLVRQYRERLKRQVPQVTVPFPESNGNLSYHIFPILLPCGYAGREHLMARMAECGVQTSIHYTPIHWFSAFRDESIFMPVLDGMADRILTLPLFARMSPEDVNYVVESLDKCL
ncbi:aminotransferase class I/II-fold pyridoxal phosphate-dependent enzyme [Azospirillum formosense]|uniref:Aminotransferase class I/II-fold pyridoxal phosphate-dependent enzyme n=1 Tax=Azospirillum formosense TaxID=861533 RepID=A0ABX2KSH0_9PROT|nr:DegT/DnrJ/EryC1/StrS family aminotransferase [Azospirillum formosense]MBY3757595.1 DegT/DnrJ/EryC1/StrS family aminotransferase [Azospirillum formosense]NUB19521.1 aminotransferase class I/II-fold pyridoxal phosphate-dependent enzyme [Azospirillum formosense]